MVDENVNPVHQQYMDLSARYKAGWTFHRFIQGLRKFFGSQDLEDHTAEFQELYSGLKDVSKRLNDPDIQGVIASLQGHVQRLDALMAKLEESDRRVAPSLVRLFFQRVRTYDDRIILDLIRFYLAVQHENPWDTDRIDKVDYLLTRLAEAVAGEDPGGDRSRLTRVLEGVSAQLTLSADVGSGRVANRLKMIEAVRGEIHHLEDFEQLTETNLVGHYRNLKHGLGQMLFEKRILPAVVDTNLVLASRIRELTQQEEKRILDDYEKVSRLVERGEVGRELSESVDRLHDQVSHFRKQVGRGTLRLHDMAQIRGLVLEILRQVERSGSVAGSRPGSVAGSVAEDLRPESFGDRLAPNAAIQSQEQREILGPVFEDLVAVLGESTAGDPGDRRLSASAQSYRLEDRELTAFNRLASGESCDESLESFLLVAAALRRRINDEVSEIHSRRSSDGGGEPTTSPTTDAILKLGDLFLHQFSHFLESSLLGGESARARSLQRLRMRLMRDYSGLWLVAHS